MVHGRLNRSHKLSSDSQLSVKPKTVQRSRLPSLETQWQRALGNQAYGQFLQAKLTISQPGDRYEQEADKIAEQVMRMPNQEVSGISDSSSTIQRTCTACASGQKPCPKCATEEKLHRKPLASTITPLIQRQNADREENEILQAKGTHSHTSEVTSDVQGTINDMQGGGQPLPESDRAFFEERFGCDFSHVRIHVDTKAAKAVQAVNARAFTRGNQVIFGAGHYAPATNKGRLLLAHELTHVVQQTTTREKLQLKSARQKGLGREKPKTDCEGPVCFPDPTEIIGFEFDSDQLRPDEEERLKALAKFLGPNDFVSILGYASVEGSQDYNFTLACHRANKVKEILEKTTQATIRSVHAVGETSAFGPELVQNRVAQIFFHLHSPQPAPTPPAVEPSSKTPEPLNCGCPGTWVVTGAVPAPSLLGLVKCRCKWQCVLPPGIDRPQPRPTFGCAGGPPRSKAVPPPRWTWGSRGGAIGEDVEMGKKCLCDLDDCMTNVDKKHIHKIE